MISTSGDEMICRCPWHDDKGKPNLYVNAQKGLFLCMSCGAKGRLGNDGVQVNGRCIVIPPLATADVRDRLRAITAKPEPLKVYSEAWLRQFDVPTDYWTDRGLSQQSIDRFQLGFDPFGDRVTIPLRDERGRLLGVSKRTVIPDVKPKYLDPPRYPKGRYLFGAWLIEDQTKVALVEGLVDTVSNWESRIPTLGLMGSRLTRDQRKVLVRLGIQKVVTMTDNDKAGQDAIWQINEMLRGSGIQHFVGWYRPYWLNAHDPDGLTDQRRRKMYHSAVPFRAWKEAMQSQ